MDMQSLVLVEDSYGPLDHGGRAAGPAVGDRHLLPLGLIQKPSANGGGATSAGSGQKPAARPDGWPSSLPSPPPGPPVMVLFPATLHLAVFFAPASPATLVSALLTVLAILGSWGLGWGVVSGAGIGSGLAAGVAVGLGVRTRPVGGWGYASLLVVGVALLGGGVDSTALGASLALSTLWRHGWWLYLQPEFAPVLFLLSRVTADVSIGFLLSSLLQIHRTPPPPQQDPSASLVSAPPPPETAAAQSAPVSQGDMWSAVTPPGLVGLRGRRL